MRITSSIMSCRRGFTLTEVLIATVIGGIVLAGAASCLNLLARTSLSVDAYISMNSQSRWAMETLARDARMGDRVISASDTSFSFKSYNDLSGSVVTVTYAYDSTAQTLTQTRDGVSRVLLKNLSGFDFDYFDDTGMATTTATSVKSVRINAKMQNNVLGSSQSNSLISARYIMRNVN